MLKTLLRISNEMLVVIIVLSKYTIVEKLPVVYTCR